MKDYFLLGKYLSELNEDKVSLSYDQINEILGFKAISEKRNNSIYDAYEDLMNHNYKIDSVNLLDKTVTFVQLNIYDTLIREKIIKIFEDNSFTVVFESQQDDLDIKPYINIGIQKNDIILHFSLVGYIANFYYESKPIKKLKKEVNAIANKYNNETFSVHSFGVKGEGYSIIVEKKYVINLEEIESIQKIIFYFEENGIYELINSIVADLNELKGL